MNDYLLSVPSLSGMENHLFFPGGACYNTQDGTRIYMGTTIADSNYVGRFVVIDGRILALCDKKHPRFLLLSPGSCGKSRRLPPNRYCAICRCFPGSRFR